MTKSRHDGDVKGQRYLANILRQATSPLDAEALFRLSDLPLIDFYKQLGWEVQQGYIRDNRVKLEAVA